MISVRFTCLTGLKRRIFRNARLAGSWNDWAELPMSEIVAQDPRPFVHQGADQAVDDLAVVDPAR